MSVNKKCWMARSGQIGDTVCSIPLLTYIDKIYPDSFKYWVIGKKFSQCAQLFLNHLKINQIYILETPERVESKKDIETRDKCSLVFNVTPEHPDGPPGTTEKSCWWNYYDIYSETVRMSGIILKDYHSVLNEKERIPKLEQWFDIDKRTQTIAVWCMAGYGTQPKRSPSLEKWNEIVNYLLQGYDVIRLGHPNEPNLSEEIENGYGYQDLRDLPFFEQIKVSLGCSVSISTNSGSSLVLAAYGAKQITLLTNDAPFHTTNLSAFGPKNINDLNYNIITKNGFDNLEYETVLNAINLLK